MDVFVMAYLCLILVCILAVSCDPTGMLNNISMCWMNRILMMEFSVNVIDSMSFTHIILTISLALR